MGKFLAIADADKIHEYVFSPRELKMIRGGSAIQVDLNYEDLPRIVTENGGTVIFRGGGTLLAEFPSSDAADKFCKDSEREFAAKTKVATVSTAKAPYDPPRFKESLRRVRNSLERSKQERRERVFNGGGSYWANCHACGVFPAMGFSRSEPSTLLCEACGLREQASKRWKNYSPDIEPPEDFNAIGALAKPEGYVALIYIDLDRLGKHLSDYAEDSEARYEKVSTLIDKSVKEAVQESCKELPLFPKDGKNHAGYEILLRGGDDAVILVPAQYGWRVLERFEHLFRDEYLSAKTDTPVPKFSAGVVIAHQRFPISDFLAISEELLRSAKSLKEENSVDFAIISSSMAEDPLAERKRESGPSGNYRTMKPYGLADLIRRINGVRELKKAAPASKVKALYRIAYEDNSQAELDYLDVLTRLDEESAEKLRPLIGPDFWTTAASGQRGTCAADIVELWDFCEWTA